jgi:hypothetical protein
MDYILPEDYIKLKLDPVNLFSAIYNIEDKEKRKQFLIEINQKDNIDICEYAVKAIENGYNALYISIMLGDVIEELKLNKESLLKYFMIIYQSSQGNTYYSIQYSQIHNITLKQPVFAEKFMAYLMQSDVPIAFQYIVEIILSLDRKNNEKHSQLLLIANSDIDSKSICGINGLGRIKYQTEDDHELLNKTLLCFDSLIRQEQHMINGIITKSLGFLYSFGDQIIPRLISLSKRNDSYILMEITKFLYFEYKNIKKEHYFETLLFSLTKVNSDQMDIIKELDMLLYSIVDDTNCQINTLVNFLLKWMSESDCNPRKIESLRLLDMTFHGIYSKKSVLQEMLLLLFNNDNLFAPQLAAYIITSNKLLNEQNIYFDPNSLSSLNHTDIIYICRKILGNFILPGIIISLFYSILLAKKDDRYIVELICNCFNEYIGHNYPETTIEIITGLLDSVELNISYEKTLQKILKNIKMIRKDRAEKPFLKELEPSKKDLYLLHREEWQTNQKYIELAKRKSIIDLIASKSYIKYGKSASYYIDGHITDATTFKEFSYSVERAYDVIVDPVGFDIERFKFRNAKRGEN